MSYTLGIDLGTTFTAAAVVRGGPAEIVNLGERASSVPSVVFLKDDGSILVGVPAERRAITEPDRVAREFKRRFGDTTPMFLGGSPLSADVLTAKVLKWAYEAVVKTEGSPPKHLALTYPANWGPYKRELLDQTVTLAGLQGAITLTEPEAAAIHYATTEKVDAGQIVAVYDLGGGTFDAAILERTSDGFAILGKPEGIERLGGIDFDSAVYAHVSSALGGEMAALDPDDPATVSAVARLRLDCVEAKEALSSDTEASIPVMLPNLRTEIRITRAEFEDMIRPTIAETVESMRRALSSAGRTAEDIAAVLLVGGSSRIPLVADMISSALGRPIAVDAHPKHSVSLGAAIAARREAPQAPPVADAPPAAAKRSRGPLVGGVIAAVALILAGVFILPDLMGSDPQGSAVTTVAESPLSTTEGGSVPASIGSPTTPVDATTLPGGSPSEMCGTVITADFVLSESVGNCEGDGLVVGVGGITVDLGGLTVSGNRAEGTAGIRVSDLSDVTIVNGTITGFEAGVVLDGTTNVTIAQVVATGNTIWGLLAVGASSGSVIVESTFADNGETGIHVDLGTFSTSNNKVIGNGGDGVFVAGAEGVMDGDTIEGSGKAGLAVVGVEVEEGTTPGVSATGLSIRANVTGVFFGEGGRGSVSDSVIEEQTSSGVRLRDSGELTLERNQINSNPVGVWVEDGSLRAVENVLVGNATGVEIGGGGATFRDNQVRLSEGHGFSLSGGEAELVGNRSDQNSGSGYEISSSAFVIDGGGNSASGNGQACSAGCPLLLDS